MRQEWHKHMFDADTVNSDRMTGLSLLKRSQVLALYVPAKTRLSVLFSIKKLRQNIHRLSQYPIIRVYHCDEGSNPYTPTFLRVDLDGESSLSVYDPS